MIFACAARLNVLEPLTKTENEDLQEVWNVPMAGFYIYSEYGREINGNHEFQSTTNSWVALKEK